jgi:hypothetical protein
MGLGQSRRVHGAQLDVPHGVALKQGKRELLLA